MPGFPDDVLKRCVGDVLRDRPRERIAVGMREIHQTGDSRTGAGVPEIVQDVGCNMPLGIGNVSICLRKPAVFLGIEMSQGLIEVALFILPALFSGS